MKDRKTVIVIGAGVSGLSAAINAERNGLHAILLESMPYVGGFCTGWYRRGRYIDGCIHWLTGTKKGTDLYNMWKDVDAFDDEDIINLPSFGTFEYQGQAVTLWCDLDRSIKEWTEVSPVDKKQIERFFKMVKDMSLIDTPCDKPANRLPFKKLMKFAMSVVKNWKCYLWTMKVSCEQYAKKFKSPVLRNAIINGQPGPGNLFCFLYSYSTLVANNGGIPKGGSKNVAERMKNRFIELGGTLKTSCKVAEILTDDKKALGVKLEDGSVIYGDYIVPALASEVVLKDLLKDRYVKLGFQNRVQNYKNNHCPSCVLVTFDIEDLGDINIPYTFDTREYRCGDSIINNINMRSYAYDKETYVKGNRTIVQVLIDQYEDDFYAWDLLYRSDKEQYYKEKNILAMRVQRRIIERFPHLEGKIHLLDVATPHTMERYTASTRGAYMSFLFTKHNSMYSNNGRISGLNNVFLASQWMASPGGLPFALMTGNYAIQRICEKENLSFVKAGTLAYKK